MKKSNRIILICICSLLIISILVGICFLMFKSCEKNKAHAEYSDIVLNPNSIIIFNQIVFDNRINFKSVVGAQPISDITTIANHIYYYHFIADSIESGTFTYQLYYTTTTNNNIKSGSGANSYVGLYTCTASGGTYRIYANGVINFKNVQIIDLTLMFGNGNEPNLNQCNSLFVADYYSYNTGEEMSLNGLNAYNKALQDIFSSYTYQLSMNALSNSTYSVNYDNESSIFEYNSENQHWYFLNTFAVPLYTTISNGSKINIDYWFYAPNFEGDYYLNIMYYTGDGYSTIYTDTQKINTGDGNSVTFNLPISVNTLYFNIVHNNNVWTGGNMLVFKFDISASQLDITQAIQNAYQSGFNDYVNTLKEGNSVYDAIFQRGYNACADGQAVFSDSWAFLGSVFSGLGDMLSVEFFPNLPIGLFVALPLLLGLIFFIVKLTKGG